MNVNAGINPRVLGGQNPSKNDGRKVGPYDAHGIALGSSTGGIEPLRREGAPNFSLALQVRKERRECFPKGIRHAKALGKTINESPFNRVQKLGKVQADKKEASPMKIASSMVSPISKAVWRASAPGFPPHRVEGHHLSCQPKRDLSMHELKTR